MMKIVVVLGVLLAVSYGRQGFRPGEQDWAYVEVRPKAHMFWWLYKTTAKVSNITEKPLVIWLQGGPGSASTGLGNFGELGPLDIDLKRRNKTWVKEVNVLFIDNPVGAGYSYVENLEDLATTNKQIADDLLTCIFAFYKRQPRFRNVPLYIAGESYGGKMALELAVEASKLSGNETINLKGIYLFNSLVSPIDLVVSWAPYLYQVGGVDHEGVYEIEKNANDTKEAVDNGEFEKALSLYAETEKSVEKAAKNINLYNILTKVTASGDKSLDPGFIDEAKLDKLMNGPVKKALNMNVTHGAQKAAVSQALNAEFMKPVTHLVDQLLNKTTIKVAVITSQLDLVSPPLGTLKWVYNLRFKYVNQWRNAPRDALVANNINEGYQKKYGKFSLYWVNRAGHRVPPDNPDAALAILLDILGVNPK